MGVRDLAVNTTGSLTVQPADNSAKSALTGHGFRLLLLTVLLRPFGNLSLAWGMRHFQSVLGSNPFLYLSALLSPYVLLGIVMLVLSLLTRMALLSFADLSFVLPLTAIGYIITTVLSKLFLNEQISPMQWLGNGLVVFGVALVGKTSLRTTPPPTNLSGSGSE